MLVRCHLSIDDHLAWYDRCICGIPRSGLLSVPVIGPLLSAHRRKRFMQGVLAAGNRSAVGARTIELSPIGVREFASDFDFTTAWKDLAQAIVTDEHLFLAHPSMNAHIIPLRSFESDAARDSFVSFVFRHTPSSLKTGKG